MNAVAKQQRSAKKRRTADPVPSSAARPKKKSPLYNLPQNYYAPCQGAESMSAAELSEWRKEQRKKRNRESASISRNKNKLRLEKLEGERDHYKMRCKLLEDQMKGMQKRFNLLEQAIATNGRLDVAIETPVGIQKEWRAAPVFKKREREQEHYRHESEGGSDAEDDEQGWMTPHKETHPKIKEMMREYYDKFDHIKGTTICQKAGVSVKELKLGNACLNYILGLCNKRECTRTRRHPRAEDATDWEVTQLCKKLKSGVDAMTGAKRRRMGESDQDDWAD